MRVLLSFCFLLALTGCGPVLTVAAVLVAQDGGSSSGGGAPAPAASFVVGPAGGEVTIAGVRINVPPGVIQEPSSLSVNNAADLAEGEYVRVDSARQLGPQELSLTGTIEVTLPFSAAQIPASFSTSDLVVLFRPQDGSLTVLSPSVVDASAGTLTVRISAMGTLQVAVRTGPDPARSSVQVSPSTVLANGSAQATVTVTLRNPLGQPVPGIACTITVSGSGSSVVQPDVTNANGVAQGTVSSTVAETKQVMVRAGSADLSETPSLTFVASFPAFSLASVSPGMGLETGGTAVTLKGTGFSTLSAPSVLFNGQQATNIVVVDDGTLTCTTPATTPPAGGFVNVSLAGVTLTGAFRYVLELLELDFSGGPGLPAGLQDPSNAYQVSGGVIRRVTSGSRAYVETVNADYLLKDFVYELTYTNPPGFGITFPGFGDHQSNQEPIDAIFLRSHGSTLESGKVTVDYRPPLAVGGVAGNSFHTPVLGNLVSGGPHRFRVEKVANRVTVQIDVDFNGTFAADITHVIPNVEVDAPFLTPTNTRLFFGTGRTQFTYDDMRVVAVRGAFPRVRRVTPGHGPAAGGTAVTVHGEGFQTGGVTNVTFGGASASAISVVDDRTLTCTTPAGAGVVDVAVTTADGTTTSPGGFEYEGPFFSDDFEGVVLSPNIDNFTGDYRIRDTWLIRSNTGNGRRYVRTIHTDYGGRDFDCDVAFRGSGTFYVSLGSSVVDGGTGELGNAVFVRASLGGAVDLVVAPNGGPASVTNLGALPGGGPSMVRLAKRGNQLTASVDTDFSGVFAADLSAVINDLTVTAPFLGGVPNRLVFGAGSGTNRFVSVEVRTP